MIARTFIERPVLASVLSILIVIAGTPCHCGCCQFQQYPQICHHLRLSLSASYSGATAEAESQGGRQHPPDL